MQLGHDTSEERSQDDSQVWALQLDIVNVPPLNPVGAGAAGVAGKARSRFWTG